MLMLVHISSVITHPDSAREDVPSEKDSVPHLKHDTAKTAVDPRPHSLISHRINIMHQITSSLKYL
jgi:hypothetical protein